MYVATAKSSQLKCLKSERNRATGCNIQTSNEVELSYVIRSNRSLVEITTTIFYLTRVDFNHDESDLCFANQLIPIWSADGGI
jgi:hypothetical protein